MTWKYTEPNDVNRPNILWKDEKGMMLWAIWPEEPIVSSLWSTHDLDMFEIGCFLTVRSNTWDLVRLPKSWIVA